MINSYFKKLMTFLMLNVIVMQLLFSIVTVIQFEDVYAELKQEIIDNKVKYYKGNINVLCNNIEETIKVFKSSDTANLITTPYGLLSDEKKEEFYDRRGALIKNGVYGKYIDGICIFGENQHYYSICKNISSGDKMNADILSRAKITPYLYEHFETIFVFNAADINISTERLTEAESDAVRSFIEAVNGKYVYVGYTCELTIMSINADFFKKNLFYDDGTGYIPCIVTGKDETVFGKTYRDNINELLYTGKIENTNNYFKLISDANVVNVDSDVIFFLVTLTLLNMGILVACFIGGKIYVNRILLPYRCLNNIFSLTCKESKPNVIELENSNFIKKKTIKHNIIHVAVIIVIIPALISSIACSMLISDVCTRIEEKNYIFYENQVKNNLEYELYQLEKSIESDAEIVDGVKNDSRSYSFEKNTLYADEKMLFKRYAIYDENANVVELSNSMFNNTEYSASNRYISDCLKKEQEDFFVFSLISEDGAMRDVVYGKKLFDDNGEPKGYFLRFEANELLGDLRAGNISEIAIEDKYNVPMILNTYSVLYDDTVRSNYDNYIVEKRPLDICDMTLYTMRNTEYYTKYMYRSNLIWLLLLILIDLIIMWAISIKFTSPLDEIKSDMYSNREGIKLASKNRYNEIGEVIFAYNEMVKYINGLIEEKTKMAIRQQELIVLKSKAELNVLQHQINPHFLYNTLEMLNMKALMKGDNEACDIIAAMTKIFRYSIGKSDEMVSLSAEVDNVKNYMLIQQKRFGKRIEIIWDIDKKSNDLHVIKMLFQPIVENSLVHGLHNFVSDGKIIVKTEVSDNILKIIISDNGIGMREEQLEALKNRIYGGKDDQFSALENIYKRLQLSFSNSYMEIESEYMNGTVVTITIDTKSEVNAT